MDANFLIIAVVVILGLGFDFINGFHDTANAVATSISTRALSPRRAILLAASMNLVGAITFTGVAKTIGGSIASPEKLPHGMVIIIAALVSAILWNLITWWFGIPSSSSHALIGSVAGAVISAAGFHAINWSGFLGIIKALIVSPILALVVGYIIMTLLGFMMSKVQTPQYRANKRFRFVQIATAALQSFAHGTNDAQKSMGIITFALIAGGFHDSLDTIPMWVRVAASIAMGLGTAIGGWKIIKTVGGRIMKIEPVNGVAADLSSALIIFVFSKFGLPVSSTHVISSSIMGVGAAKRIRAVKWGTAQRIVITWIITLPISAALAALVYLLFSLFF